MTTKTKLTIAAAVFLLIAFAAYRHKQTTEAEELRARMELSRRARDTAAVIQSANEQYQRDRDWRPAPPPQRNPQLDELNRNLEAINQSVQSNERAVRDATLQQIITGR